MWSLWGRTWICTCNMHNFSVQSVNYTRLSSFRCTLWCFPKLFYPTLYRSVFALNPVKHSKATYITWFIINSTIFPTLCSYVFHMTLNAGRDKSVGRVTRYRLDGPGIESRWGELFPICPDRPWGPPSPRYNGQRVSFPGVKRPERDVDHTPSSSAEVKERVALHLYSPSWSVAGWPLPLPVIPSVNSS